jgi:hypothetical protein
MIEKRIRAHRSRIGGSASSLIASLRSQGADPPVAGAFASASHGSWITSGAIDESVAALEKSYFTADTRAKPILCGTSRSHDAPRKA